MRILVIMPELPYPKHKNGACSTVNSLISHWKEENLIDILYFGEKDLSAEEHLRQDYHINAIHNKMTGKEYLIRIGKRYFIKPRNSWFYRFKAGQSVDVSAYDTIFFGSFVAGLLYNRLLNIETKNVIFFEADSLSLYYKRSMNIAESIVRKLYCLSQKFVTGNIEKVLYQKVNRTIFVSEVDYNYTIKRNGLSKITDKFVTIPIGVDIAQIRTKSFDFTDKPINICFSGIMDYEPNVKAVEYIFRHIVPGLDKTGLNYKIHLLGKNPKEEWKNNEGVKEGKVVITGFVENFDQYLADMDFYISPLFLGTGMKNKILQAMGVGLPIICSEVSVEGIVELKDKENVLICEDKPEVWVDRILMLASDTSLMEQFSKRNMEIIQNKYNWKTVADRMMNSKVE